MDSLTLEKTSGTGFQVGGRRFTVSESCLFLAWSLLNEELLCVILCEQLMCDKCRQPSHSQKMSIFHVHLPREMICIDRPLTPL